MSLSSSAFAGISEISMSVFFSILRTLLGCYLDSVAPGIQRKISTLLKILSGNVTMDTGFGLTFDRTAFFGI